MLFWPTFAEPTKGFNERTLVLFIAIVYLIREPDILPGPIETVKYKEFVANSVSTNPWLCKQWTKQLKQNVLTRTHAIIVVYKSKSVLLPMMKEVKILYISTGFLCNMEGLGVGSVINDRFIKCIAFCIFISQFSNSSP